MARCESAIREALVTADGPWRYVRCLDEIDSTNAFSLAHPRPWQVVTCRHQRAGRGRHSRPWVAPAGASVALSVTVPMPPEPTSWGWLPLVTGLAVLDALGEVTGSPHRFALKWPNDVLAQESTGVWGKICGILCELAPTATGPLVVAGVGLNVALERADLPVPTATSLTLAGFERPGGAEVVVAVARAFAAWHDRWYGGSRAGLRAAYRARCDTLQRDVEVHLPDGALARGRAVDIAAGGELLVDVAAEDGNTVRHAFAAGDVIHVRRSGAQEVVGTETIGRPVDAHRTPRSGMIGP